MKKIGAVLYLLLLFHGSWSQNTIGLPDITNYPKQFYRAGAQNRQIRQDKNGILYFANSEGLLTFDGINWKVYPLPNKSIVRCLEFGPDSKLYVGGQDEFGYFSPATNGQLTYHSLKEKVPLKERTFTDVWEIYFFNNNAFFQTSNKIFQVSGDHCSVYNSVHWRFITVCNNRLIAQDFDKGLLLFENGAWQPFLKKSDLPADFFATSLSVIGQDSALLTTVKNGVYLMIGDSIKQLRSDFLESIKETHLSASVMVNPDHIALTTNLNGCYIIDKKGFLVQSFSRKEGLQNNNILDIFLDKEKNLWLGLDNGIDFISYNNAIKHIYPDYVNEGSGYAAGIYKNELYIGTSSGLYKSALYPEKDLSYIKGEFRLVNNTKGQVWNLSEVNGQLLMGHHDGAFVIENNTAKAIDKTSGFWTFLPFHSVLPSGIIVAGSYQGINFYDYKDGVFTNKNIVAHFESARYVCMDNEKIWISHPYKGIYQVQLEGNVTRTKNYTQQAGLKSAQGNYIFKIRNAIILATENGVFEYDQNSDSFKPSGFYNDLFPGKNIRYMREDEAGNIWFVYNDVIGVVDMSVSKPQVIYFPELSNKFVSGYENIFPLNKNNIFIGGDKGFYHINYEQYKNIKYPLRVQITAVKLINSKDSVLFGGYSGDVNDASPATNKNKQQVEYASNSLHFEFASPVYAQQSNIEYSYFLEGFDRTWSAFSKKTQKDYTNLPAGTYSFKVKARNNLGDESPIGAFQFSIMPPWYQSRLTYILYFLLFVVGNYAFLRFLKRKFRKQKEAHDLEQKRLLYLHQLEMEKTEKEIVKLKNEKLESEISHKNTELASAAMHLVQKGELLGKIKEEIVRLKKQSGFENGSDDLKKIIRVLSEEEKVDKQWEQFTVHFDNVHDGFLSGLKAKYPALTPHELKLSAYLRMNLSSKEIAQLLNISVRGAELNRYRLRKKLQIPAEMTLYDFLTNQTGSG
jgi:ligand-binding sensor domain-containing protein/DNA-binding CsgD family transcriptional regulator